MVKILNVDYNQYVVLVGTACFTKRSINDAYEAIKSSKPKDVAVELDWKRFKHLNSACVGCPKISSCEGLCEFTSAAQALGNVDANIWLIDISQEEMQQRIRSQMSYSERQRSRYMLSSGYEQDPVWLWERG